MLEPTAATWIAMIAVVGFVWGGLATVLFVAFASESSKGADG